MLKNTIILISIISFLYGCAVSAQNINVDNFDELITSTPASGDTITFTRNLDADSTIGNLFANLDINFEGNNYSILGNDQFGGFVLNQDTNFHQVGIRNCQGQSYGSSKFAGAIYNNGGQTDIQDSIFSENFTDAGGFNFSVGGAIYNLNDGSIDINNSQFINNYTYGGSSYGGAIANGYNSGTETIMHINNSVFNDNHSYGSVTPYGGAIYNNSQIFISNSSLEGNYAEGEDGIFGYGGALYNLDYMNISNSTIKDNYAKGGENALTFGGAIFNDKTLIIDNSQISGNHTDTPFFAAGGAIFNSANATAEIKNSTIENNYISTSAQNGNGGAIYNAGVLTVENTTFKNNTDHTGELNDIYNDTTGTINFDGNGTTTILSGIAGRGNITKDGNGSLNLGGKNENFTGNFTLAKGNLNLLAGGSYFNAQNTRFDNGVNFNMQNNEIDSVNFGDLTLSGTSNVQADVNLNNNTMDRINANSVSGTGDIHVSSLLFHGEELRGNNVSIPFADSVLKNHVTYTPQEVETPIFNYNSSYDSGNGHFNLTRGGLNSSTFVPGVAAQLAGYLTQIDTYKNVFANLDMVMITPPDYAKSYHNNNRIANASSQFSFSPLTMPENRNGIWFKPYSTFERVGLKNGPSVSNVSYGSMFGGESGVERIKHGWSRIYGAYLSYNGSHQAFQGNSIYNNGGLVGADAVFYKGNFFTAWTANVGANSAEASTKFGRDNFAMLNTGIAEKTGYNFELLERKLIVQPSLLMSYSFINTFNYTTQSGVHMDSDPLHAIHIEPEIKLIGNFKNYLQPYISVSMVWNIMDQTHFKANDVYLPDLSVKPFVQYGVGIQKRWGERITGFLEGMIRNGGRNGIALMFGVRISL